MLCVEGELMDAHKFGAFVAEVRKENGMTQTDLTKNTGYG